MEGGSSQKKSSTPAWVWRRGFWSRTRLWAIYWGYVTYLFMHNAWISIGVMYIFEAINFLTIEFLVGLGNGGAGLTEPGTPRTWTVTNLAIDLWLRTVHVFVGVFLAVFIAYTFDLTRVEGLRNLSYSVLAVSFVALRDFGIMHVDYAIIPVHAVFFLAAGDGMFFAEPWTYGVFAVYTTAILIMLIVSDYIGYLSFGIFFGVAFVVIGSTLLATMGSRKMDLSFYV